MANIDKMILRNVTELYLFNKNYGNRNAQNCDE